jgi:hypothetical protein
MPTITLDDADYEAFESLRRQAAARGFSIGEWIRIKLNQPTESQGTSPDQLSAEEFKRRMDAFKATLRGRGGNADFSRDAIYD